MSAPTFALGSLLNEVATRVPGDRPAVVCDGVVTPWSEFIDHARRFAGVLSEAGFGSHPEREGRLESPHDHVGLMLDNGAEFLECTAGASIAGATAVSINTRYAAPEAAALLEALDVRVLIHASRLQEVARAACALMSRPPVRISTGVSYEEALAAARPQAPGDVHAPSSADRVIICTGGTTGTPKGVLWRSDDFFVSSLRGFEIWRPDLSAVDALDALLSSPPPRAVAPTPLVHFAASAVALQALVRGGTALLLPTDRSFDADAFVELAEQHSATDALVIGDVTSRPVAASLEARGYQLPALRCLMAGSTLMSVATKRRLLNLLPNVEIRDSMGSSETGMQAVAVARRDAIEDRFSVLPGNAVLDPDGGELSGDGVGVLARLTNRSIGYYRNPSASGELWRDGIRGPYTATGDTVRRHADGTFSLLGRGSMTINSGGEKIFAQEVESAISQLPEVVSCLVVAAPSARWGREVHALIVWDGEPLTLDEVRVRLADKLARYKVPKRIWAVDDVPTLNNGKPDYAEAERLVSVSAEASPAAGQTGPPV